MRGAAILSVCSNEDESSATVRFDSVEWVSQATSEACIGQVVRLFSAVGVRQLEINSGLHGLASKTLKAVLQSCPQLTKLEWRKLLCDDFSELENAAWPSSSGELRALRLSVSRGNDSAVLMVMNALLARVGSQLTSLTLSALRSALSGPMADVIVARCPRLRHLDVTNANAHFHEKLVEAFDADRCGVTLLTVQNAWGSQGNDCGLLLASLKDPARGTSRRLRTFTLGEAWTSIDIRQAAAAAFLKVLSSKLTVQYVNFWGDTTVETRQKFKALPLQFVVRFPSMRRRLALLSVCGGHEQRFPKLLPDVLGTIFEFDGRRGDIGTRAWAERYEHDGWAGIPAG